MPWAALARASSVTTLARSLGSGAGTIVLGSYRRSDQSMTAMKATTMKTPPTMYSGRVGVPTNRAGPGGRYWLRRDITTPATSQDRGRDDGTEREVDHGRDPDGRVRFGLDQDLPEPAGRH